ncbi:hypothetical protein L3Q72_09340 [Vibrio sp. JC009]|uniref:hypothetical protein n=1 Tax=Vibrio sp. JC009 TaxID=2912314 RepID=UPI0023B061F4|nr:hypothetical protein [Vibrio sp. JC009]WED20847.1 hypothetical protein L3Q72_09340 [Vibrio sp. JC009]
MELRNSKGETTKLADNLTLKEVVDMGFSIDICDRTFDPNEHWQIEGQEMKQRKDFPED